jgi:hypothetical protein
MRLRKLFALATASGMTLALFGATPASAAPPTNDAFAGATAATLGFTETIDTSEATTDADDAQLNESCGAPATDASVWYAFTTAVDTNVVVDVSQSDYSAGVLVGTGTQGNLFTVSCAPGSTGFFAESGTTYYVLAIDDQEDGAGNGGTLVISFSEVVPIEMTVTIDSTGRLNRQTNEVTVSGTLTCNQSLGVELSVRVRQRAGRLIINGDGFSFVECDDSGPFAWEVVTEEADGIFVSGKATVQVFAFACNNFDCVEVEESTTIRLRR